MHDWKRMIPGITGASLALGGSACGGSSTHSISDIAKKVCEFQQACDPTYFYFDTIAECVQASVAEWNTDVVPDLQRMGGNACVDAYTSLYDCVYGLVNVNTCVDPWDAAVQGACASSYASVVDTCTDVGGHGAAIEAAATASCQDYMACDPTSFASYYGSVADCITERRFDLADSLAAYSDACVTATLAYHQCMTDAYTAPACDSLAAENACAAASTTADTACGGSHPFVAGQVNKGRGEARSHQPRWLRGGR